MTAATMFMDVVTNFGRPATSPTQADKLERGPVRLRSALQFSLNIPRSRPAIINGLDHEFDAVQGLRPQVPERRSPVVSMGIGTLEIHPIDMRQRLRRDRRTAAC